MLSTLLGGILGFTVGGPVGAFIGGILGSMFDGKVRVETGQQRGRGYHQSSSGRQRVRTTEADFHLCLAMLSAAVMKADGKVLKSELSHVKGFFKQNFGEAVAAQYVSLIGEMLKKEIPVHEAAKQIGQSMLIAQRLQLLHYLFGVAAADGHVHSSEVEMIERIALNMRVPERDMASIKAMFYQEVDSAYTILEVDASATDDEVKKAYRRMAKRYHPDKVATLGEEVKKGATQKFKQVQEAYEQVKKERGMN